MFTYNRALVAALIFILMAFCMALPHILPQNQVNLK
jgi:hypothetical protein